MAESSHHPKWRSRAGGGRAREFSFTDRDREHSGNWRNRNLHDNATHTSPSPSAGRSRGRGGNRGRGGHQNVGSQSDRFNHFPPRCMKMPELHQLEREVDEGKLSANELLMKLVHERSGFSNLVNTRIHSPNMFSVIVQLTAKAIEEEFSPQLRLQLLQTVLQSLLLTESFQRYHEQLVQLTNSSPEHWQTVCFVLLICQSCFDLMPSESYTILYPKLSTFNNAIPVMRQMTDVPEEVSEQMESVMKTGLNVMEQRMRSQTSAAAVAGESRRQRNPPNNFRDLPIIPTPDELNTKFNDVFLQVNRVKGCYPSPEIYLDTQFRLMREDMVQPLRKGLEQFKKDPNGTRFSDIRVYRQVTVPNTFTCGREGINHIVLLDLKSHAMRRINWKISKRLIHGSLVCLSCDNFQTLHFATVQERDSFEFHNEGAIQVAWVEGYQPDERLAEQNQFVMIETTAFFESYRHVLNTLQEMPEHEVPFSRYFVECNTEVHQPRYLARNDTLRYNFNCIIDDADHRHREFDRVDVRHDQQWPSMEALGLDGSQFQAMKTAMTHELAVIQGPPGTGKTFLGLKLAHLLVKNVQSSSPEFGPILLVCYTNHALDQFLEGILEFVEATEAVRVGGRCKSEKLKDCLLWNRRTRDSLAGSLRSQVRDCEEKLWMHHVESETAGTQLLKLAHLERFMLQQHVFSFLFHSPRSLQEQLNIQGSQQDRMSLRGRDVEQLFNFWILDTDFLASREEAEESEELTLEMAMAAEEVANEILDEIVTEAQKDVAEEEFLQLTLQGAGSVFTEVDYEHQQREVLTDGDEVSKKRQMKLLMQRGELEFALTSNFDSNHGLIDSEGFRIVINWQKVNRRIKQKLKTLTDSFDDAEAEDIENVWQLDSESRWRLYKHWVNKYRTQVAEKVERLKAQYGILREQLNEAMFEADRKVFQASRFVAMTTTGAARYRRVLRQIRPKIVIVEEAAEVLESHILASLSAGCQHLLLIGDHKQLKPNPAVHELAKSFKLDVSLFERLVNNRVRYDTLANQHRMRPEISRLVKHIYPNLLDHPSVNQYGDVKGMATNLYFFDHQHHEDFVEDVKSRSNQFESEMVVNLASYLVKQGYEANQITVLTLYSGQLFSIKRLLPEHPLIKSVRVCVCDNYQGEENDIVILSLVRSNDDDEIGFLKIENRVCVALSRAKLGLYVFGNFDLLSANSSLWRRVVRTVSEGRDHRGSSLRLACQNHPEDEGTVVSEPRHFRKCPEGGCHRICGFRMACGHACKMACHPLDKQHLRVQCKEPCTKSCPEGHPCRLKCFVECRCTVKVRRRMPKCGHYQMLQCHIPVEIFTCQEPCQVVLDCGHNCPNKCGEPHSYNCTRHIERRLLCQHLARVKCGDTSVLSECKKACKMPLPCQHTCNGTCGECSQGRLHKPCRQRCQRLLVCGHVCASGVCHSQCPPCCLPCLSECSHSSCSRQCGEKCLPCKEKCDNWCRHSRCTKLCNELCNKQECNEPCTFLHKSKVCVSCRNPLRCVSLCGESHIYRCRKCDQPPEIFFGTEEEPDAKFIRLSGCGHIFEVSGLDQWMSTPAENGAIVRKLCPICKTAVTAKSCKRYRNIVKNIDMDIEAVKQKVKNNFHLLDNQANSENEVVETLETSVTNLIDTLSAKPSLVTWLKISARSGEKINRLLTCKPIDSYAFTAVNSTAKCARLRIQQQILRQMKSFATESWFEKIANQLKTERPTVSDIHEWRRTDLAMHIFCSLSVDFVNLLSWLQRQDNPKHQDVSQVENELHRLKFMTGLCHAAITLKEATKTEETEETLKAGNAKLERCVAMVTDSGAFTEKKQQIMEEMFQQLKDIVKQFAVLTEVERKMIVSAMQLPQGHWYKCPQGHIYAIGDCGGANQVSTCPECGSSIGGENHQLIAGNRHAGEMDGSNYAAWSEEANRHLGNQAMY